MQKTCERDTKANEVHNKKEDRKKYKKKGLKNLTFFRLGHSVLLHVGRLLTRDSMMMTMSTVGDDDGDE